MKIITTIFIIITLMLFVLHEKNTLDNLEAKCNSLWWEFTRDVLPIRCVIVDNETLEIKKIHNTDLRYY